MIPCQAYWPGHNVHWIHARHVADDRHGSESTAVNANIVSVQYGLVTLDVGDERHVLAHHDVERVGVLAARYPRVVWVRRWHVVYFGNFLINVVDPEGFTPCLGAGAPTVTSKHGG
jgi:hypothetical protein